jgi:TonB-linked SusC/RagA family outer membrane protein
LGQLPQTGVNNRLIIHFINPNITKVMNLNSFTAILNRRLPQKIFLIMKITTLLLIIGLIQVSAKGFGQKITLNEKNVPLEQVLHSIELQTGYVFFYDSKDVKQHIDVHISNATLESTLNVCLQNIPLSYKIAGKTILLQTKESVPDSKAKQADNLSIVVSGQITDEQGNPLPGVTISVQGTGLGAIADDMGFYKIEVEIGKTLIFKHIGYQTQLMVIKNQSKLNVTLVTEVKNLQEVIVNKGYYTERQGLSTGDVSSVKGTDIVKAGVNDPILALEGRIPGLYVAASSGLPGATTQVLLRGQNSFLQGNSPLYIIDGVPFDSESLSRVGSAAGSISPFSALNLSDIEQIDVLKDADATAIYGSRGANGVILITTKKGKAGKTSVDVDVSSEAAKYTHFVDLLNTTQYLAMRNEAFANDNATPQDYDSDVNGTWNKNSNTNWQKTLFGGTAYTTNAQARISGGDANTQFSINGGYRKQSLVYTASDQADINASLRATITHNSLNKKFNLNLTIGYTNDNNKLPAVDLTNYITLAPDAPALHNPDGSLNWANSTWVNPLAALNSTTQSLTTNLLGNLLLSYKILPGLKIQTSVGYNNFQLTETNLQPSTSLDPASLAAGYGQRQSTYSDGITKSWIIEPQIQYTGKLFGGKLDALVGTTYQDKTSTSLEFIAQGFSDDSQLLNYSAATSRQFEPDQYSDYRYTAVYSRLNYNWLDKYVINLTARRDGSSRFGPGKQFGDFGAIGAGWIFTNEQWAKNLSWISFGKLRASYGVTGNDQIGDYNYLSTYFHNYPYENNPTLVPTQLANPLLAWEINKKAEVGLDLGFLKDRLNLSVSYYRNRTGNQLISYELPSITGFTFVEANLPAVIQNTGVEIVINTTNINNKDFKWSTSFNLTVPRNKWISFPNLENTPYANQVFIGKSVFVKPQYRYTGIDPLTGVYTYADVNKDNALTSADYVSDKEIAQNYYGGLNNSFKYKTFQLDIFFQYVKQTGRSFLSAFNAPGLFNSNEPIGVLNRWQYPGDQATTQKFSQLSNSPADQAWDNFTTYGNNNIVNTSFIRLKSASLSYTLPAKWIKNLGVSNAQIYLEGQNLFTLTPYVGLDPETGGLNLPPLRNIGIGARITLQ